MALSSFSKKFSKMEQMVDLTLGSKTECSSPSFSNEKEKSGRPSSVGTLTKYAEYATQCVVVKE